MGLWVCEVCGCQDDYEMINQHVFIEITGDLYEVNHMVQENQHLRFFVFSSIW